MWMKKKVPCYNIQEDSLIRNKKWEKKTQERLKQQEKLIEQENSKEEEKFLEILINDNFANFCGEIDNIEKLRDVLNSSELKLNDKLDDYRFCFLTEEKKFAIVYYKKKFLEDLQFESEIRIKKLTLQEIKNIYADDLGTTLAILISLDEFKFGTKIMVSCLPEEKKTQEPEQVSSWSDLAYSFSSFLGNSSPPSKRKISEKKETNSIVSGIHYLWNSLSPSSTRRANDICVIRPVGKAGLVKG